jgi:hypothetical protein
MSYGELVVGELTVLATKYLINFIVAERIELTELTKWENTMSGRSVGISFASI